MRKRFEQQIQLGATPISDLIIPLKSRDELPPVIAGLKHIFVTPELNEQVFSLLEKKVSEKKKKTGRPGMDLWEILVLATIRLTLDTDYDHLHHVANYDRLVRQVLGIDRKFGKEKEYAMQTLKDNVRLIDEETINQINRIVVEAGHRIIKKKEDLSLETKVDTYVFETNIHFPTDLGLLWDAGRKCMDILDKLRDQHGLSGWRKGSNWRAKMKNACRESGRAIYRGGKNRREKIVSSVSKYLEMAASLSEKINQFQVLIGELGHDEMSMVSLMILKMDLSRYQRLLLKFMNLCDRRILREEIIPASEKQYSIFEEHTEWISKGKVGKNVELGHKIAIVSDQYQFILSHKVVEHQHDTELAVELAQQTIPGFRIMSMSFDKGFYSAANKAALKEMIPMVVMPKRGKRNQEETEEEHSKEFVRLRHHHSAIESNINQLEHHGLNRCPDKGMKNYKRYVALGILSYNLQHLGNLLIEKQRKQERKKDLRKAA